MYGIKGERIDVVDLQSVIEELSTYRESLSSKYLGLDFKMDNLYGVPLELECELAEGIRTRLAEEAKDKPDWRKLTSYGFYEAGQYVIDDMIKETEIPEEKRNGLESSVHIIARNVSDRRFGHDVLCYKITYDRNRADKAIKEILEESSGD